MTTEELRLNAVVAEMNSLVQGLLQRNISLAAELAVVRAQCEELQSVPPPPGVDSGPAGQ